VNPARTKFTTTTSDGQQHRVILLVSGRLDHRRNLQRVFEGLNLDVLVCSNLAQAREVLSHRTPALVFCDECLPDGTYRDFLALRKTGLRIPQVVVTIVNGEWEHYLEVIRRGGFDAIRCPFTPTDVELALIHAMRAEEHRAAYPMTASRM
jgi:DNA-binding NtrC family response regulator